MSQCKPRGAALIVSLLLASWAYAGEPGTPLPEPLTLPAALSMADSVHPDVAAVEADNAARRAEQLALAALTGVTMRFDADDRADGMLLAHARQHRRTKILRCYLGVLLADLTFTLENEAMAIAYVRMNRTRERHTLGQVSDIALAERNSRYQAARHQRYAAEAAQRASRSRLALALNRPGELAATLLPPRLPGQSRPAAGFRGDPGARSERQYPPASPALTHAGGAPATRGHPRRVGLGAKG